MGWDRGWQLWAHVEPFCEVVFCAIDILALFFINFCASLGKVILVWVHRLFTGPDSTWVNVGQRRFHGVGPPCVSRSCVKSKGYFCTFWCTRRKRSSTCDSGARDFLSGTSFASSLQRGRGWLGIAQHRLLGLALLGPVSGTDLASWLVLWASWVQ